MNMIMHNEINSRIEWGDIISSPQFLDTDNRLMKFDVVASNPPFNIIGWNHDDLVHNDYGRFNLGFPPQAKGIMPLFCTWFQHLKVQLVEWPYWYLTVYCFVEVKRRI